MSDLDHKLKKLSKKLERQFSAQVILGDKVEGELKSIIPVSISKPKTKESHDSAYNEPVGVIEINRQKIRFIPINPEPHAKTLIKIFLLILTVFGLKKYFVSKKSWESEN